MANTLDLHRQGAIGFNNWLGGSGGIDLGFRADIKQFGEAVLGIRDTHLVQIAHSAIRIPGADEMQHA